MDWPFKIHRAYRSWRALGEAGIIVLLALFFSSSCAGVAKRDIFIPSTISPEAQQILKDFVAGGFYAAEYPAADDLEGWRKARAAIEAQWLPGSLKAARDNAVTTQTLTLGGVPVVDVRPKGWADNGKVLIHLHGGAYLMLTAESSMISSAPMARVSGLRVISVTYTTAPFANWKQIQGEILAVVHALLAEGYTLKDIAIYGDSAGGSLATSTAINLRDSGLGLPAALVLWSPWVDLSNDGDTPDTLATADPFLTYDTLLRTGALAYADGLDLRDPRVSPLYADYSKGFPPTLIQEGTKCIFLSTCARQYQAIVAGGQPVELDIYEGMWHVFQVFGAPESEIALRRAADFMNRHLKAH